MIDAQALFNKLLDVTISKEASDLHLSSGRPPIIRVNKKLNPVSGFESLSSETIKDIAHILLDKKQEARLEKKGDVDFGYSYQDKSRFRVAMYYQSGALSIILRLIPVHIRSIEELNLPPIVKEFTKPTQGFILVVGPTGHGKSSVLAAMIDLINHNRQDHIITIEDPIEYVFEQDNCIIDQRQIGDDVISFKRGLRSAFRADVDVIMLGEMRDAETIATAVTAAETGHLVLSTLHTNTAAQTIDRIIDSFPGEQQAQIRSQLSFSLFGIISRRLIPTLDGGLTSAAEILIVNSAIRNLIREGKISQINMSIETGADQGMISLNRSLVGLMRQGEIDQQTAEVYSPNVIELRTLIQGSFTS